MSAENETITLDELASLVSVSEFAEQLGVSRSNAAYLVRKGTVASVRVGKTASYLRQSDIDAYREMQVKAYQEKISLLTTAN